ncbi:Ankyrin repeat domain-containing protein [Tetrabaena socialis]|uniref:Ankyrin repeat domain-containing protein n=1 Tax=Tetrabaena socialis TaxID=47790 RepID=A0A2J8A6D7_9CHLO|nr:Ankyrin repeat domain-containing protein [Tetrabaena socialis]|eukprot:PNH08089.1 Ankyrin repeat domain-containing protein [Tetrabaena socialis]
MQPQLPSQQQQEQQQQQPGAELDAADDDPSRIWLPDVVHHFASFLDGNELACTLRRVNKATAAQFRGLQHTTVRLSLPVPHHAFAWRWGASDATRSLNVRQRRQLPCLTACSGSIANLEVLLARDDLTSPLNFLVSEAAAGAGQLEVCRWLGQQGCPRRGGESCDAAEAGHKAVCEWLLVPGRSVDGMAEIAAASAARGGHVGLMDRLLTWTAVAQEPDDGWGLLVEAVAAGCDLPTLQRVHHTCLDRPGAQLPDAEQVEVVRSAAASLTADWRDKVEWLEGQGYPRTDSVCTEAAERDDGPDRLAWLQQRGYPLTAYVAYAAAAHGNVSSLEFLLAQGVQLSGERAVGVTSRAASGGHLAALKVLHAHGTPMNDQTVVQAAMNGARPVVAWLLEELGSAVVLTASMFAAAAGSGSAELLAWLHQHGCPWDASVFAAAAGSGSEEQLEWLVEHGCPMGVEWLEGQGYPRTDSVCTEAAERDDGPDRLAWLQQRGYPLTAYVAYAAAAHGNVSSLEFLLAQGVQLSGERAVGVTSRAASGGHLAALKVLHAHGTPMNDQTVVQAAMNGARPVVAWLLEELGSAVVLTASMFAAAAGSGSAELLAWLHQHGCPWDASVFAAAAGSGSEEQLEWLVEHGCPMGDDGKPYQQALEYADMAVLRCLRRLGCPWGPAGRTFTYAVESYGMIFPMCRKQQLLALTWLVEQGCPVDWAQAEQEAENGCCGGVPV